MREPTLVDANSQVAHFFVHVVEFGSDVPGNEGRQHRGQVLVLQEQVLQTGPLPEKVATGSGGNNRDLPDDRTNLWFSKCLYQ